MIKLQCVFQAVASELSRAPLPIMDHFIFSRAPVDSDNPSEIAALKEVYMYSTHLLGPSHYYAIFCEVCEAVCFWSVGGL